MLTADEPPQPVREKSPKKVMIDEAPPVVHEDVTPPSDADDVEDTTKEAPRTS